MDALVPALLIAMLGSPHFGTRQAATESLEKMGDRALPVLLLYERDADPEVRQRVGRLLEARKPGMVERLMARHPQLRVDALPLNHINRWQVLSDYLGAVEWSEAECGEGPSAAPFHAAVRLLIVDVLYNGTSYADAARLLDGMAERQARAWNGSYWLDEEGE